MSPLLLLALLPACGGDAGPQSTAGISVVAVDAVAQTPVPTPTPAPIPTGDVGTDATTAGSGKALEAIPQYTYPDMATVSLSNVTFPTGATQVDVPVSLDHATPNTVHVRVKTVNGSGTNYMISGTNYRLVDKYVIFRPGDPLVQTVTIPLVKGKEGGAFRLSFPEAPQGANAGTAQAVLTALKTAAPTKSITEGFRASRTFRTGTLKYEMNVNTMRWSDKGGADAWSTSFTHGRAQTGNAETGVYLDASLYPGTEAPVSVKNGALVLHSQTLSTPITYGGRSYSYGATVLNGRNMPSTQITYGQYEWVATMPNRAGSWPALWLIGVKGWPPEIDVYEGFGQNNSWDFARDISANIHGGPINQRKFTRSMWIDASMAYGIGNIATTQHRYAVDIQPDYITWFVDGIETYQARNPFSEPFYPVMNVAVKTTGSYTGGSGDMTLSSFKVWTN